MSHWHGGDIQHNRRCAAGRQRYCGGAGADEDLQPPAPADGLISRLVAQLGPSVNYFTLGVRRTQEKPTASEFARPAGGASAPYRQVSGRPEHLVPQLTHSGWLLRPPGAI
jgi:hypothetical protein